MVFKIKRSLLYFHHGFFDIHLFGSVSLCASVGKNCLAAKQKTGYLHIRQMEKHSFEMSAFMISLQSILWFSLYKSTTICRLFFNIFGSISQNFTMILSLFSQIETKLMKIKIESDQSCIKFILHHWHNVSQSGVM